MSKVPLGDWLSSIRTELARAAERYKNEGTPAPALILQDLTLEVEVATEESATAEFGWQLWVLSGKIGGDEKGSTTQKMTLKFKPFTDIAMGDT